MKHIIEAAEDALLNKLSKSRIYVDNPDDVPEQYEVQEGSQGGYYYETGSGEVSEGLDNGLSEGQRMDLFGRPAEVETVNEDGSVDVQYDDGTNVTVESDDIQDYIDDGIIEPETDRTVDPNEPSTEADVDVLTDELASALAGTPGYDIGADPDATQDEVLQESEIQEALEDRIDEDTNVEAVVHQVLRDFLGTGSRHQDDLAEQILDE